MLHFDAGALGFGLTCEIASQVQPRGGSLRRYLAGATWGVLLATWVWGQPGVVAADVELPKTKNWIEVRSEHFTIVSNAGERQARRTAQQLERFRQALGQVTRGFSLDARVPTTTFLFRNDAAYEPYKRDGSGGVMNVAGYFLPGSFENFITLDGSASGGTPRVIYHEYFHAVMDASLGDLPLWLNEGLAEYFSGFVIDEGKGTIQFGQSLPEHALQLDRKDWMSWEELVRTTPDSPHYREGEYQGAFYAQSWLLSHQMMKSRERQAAMARYLNRLRDGADEFAAFHQEFGEEPAAMGRAAQTKPQLYRVTWEIQGDEEKAALQVRELQPAELFFRLGMLLSRRGQREPAEQHLAAAAEAGWPMGEIEQARALTAYHAAAHDEAAAALSAVTQREGAGAEALIVLGDLLMRQFFNTPEAMQYSAETPALVGQARTLLGRGIELAPANFDGLIQFAQTFLYGAEPTAPGVAALDQAAAARPLSTRVSQLRAMLLARGGEAARAWTIVERDIQRRDPEKARETRGWVADMTTMAVMERMERDDREGAQTILKAATETFDETARVETFRQMLDVVARGGKLVMSGPSEELQTAREAFTRYNQAVEMASAGQYDEALALFDALIEACAEPEVCRLSKQTGAQIRGIVERNRVVTAMNQAVEVANKGNRRKAGEILLTLEPTVQDAALKAEVQELMSKLGVKTPGKKKKKR